MTLKTQAPGALRWRDEVQHGRSDASWLWTITAHNVLQWLRLMGSAATITEFPLCCDPLRVRQYFLIAANVPAKRPTPEELLARIQIEERRERRGKLKVFLGYSSGVGKSFRMLDEGRRRRERGEDVVVCATELEYPAEIQAILARLEVIPALQIGEAESIDVAAVIRRRPQVALIDGPRCGKNPLGSLNAHRSQDVEQLLEAGISVITSVNLQYLEKLHDEVERITGKRVSYSIPRSFLDNSADEIVIVDAPATQNPFLPGNRRRSRCAARRTA